jgi:hypothetical protein
MSGFNSERALSLATTLVVIQLVPVCQRVFSTFFLTGKTGGKSGISGIQAIGYILAETALRNVSRADLIVWFLQKSAPAGCHMNGKSQPVAKQFDA